MFEWLLDLIFGKRCRICNSCVEDSFVCKKCSELLQFLAHEAHSIHNCVPIYSACSYAEPAKNIIKLLKYKKQKCLARFCAELLAQFWDFEGDFVVVPAPSHLNRTKTRGFDHILLVAQEFCKIKGYRLESGLISRTKDTQPQYNLHSQERLQNLKGAFSINKNLYNQERLLIIDDITTTGATFFEIIDTFQKNNINNLVCLSICHTKL